MKQYHLTVHRDLFFTKAALKHQDQVRVAKLLVDCGASQVMLSWATLIALKLDPAGSQIHRPIVTANGLIYMPEVILDEFHAFGQRFARLAVLAHTIPLGTGINGVIGMNFLRRFDTCLNFKRATMQI